MPDLESVRAVLPALQSLTYLNSGTAGPLPRAAVEAMTEVIDTDARRGRISGRRFAKIARTEDTVRNALAELVNAPPENVMLTSGTTEGLELALSTVDWSAGDRVITTNLEHPAVVGCLDRLRIERGVDVRFLELSDSAGTDQDLALVRAAIRPGVRVVLLSHVSYATGSVLPVKTIVQQAHDVGATVIVDGAQAVGALSVDFTDLGADYYAFSGQKWLLGPEGTGALIIGSQVSDRRTRLHPRGTRSNILWAGLSAALDWRRMIGAESELVAAINDRAGLARERLLAVPGITVVTPGEHAGLVAFSVDDAQAEDFALRLGLRRIATRAVDSGRLVRSSFGFFTTEAEIDGFVDAVADEAISGSTPISGLASVE